MTAGERRPEGEETAPYGVAPAPWAPPLPTRVEEPAWSAPYTPVRSGRVADVVVSVVLLVLGVLAGLVATLGAFTLQVLQVGCDTAEGPCGEAVKDGVATALLGPWLVFLPLAAVATLLMARGRTSWWVSALALLGATAVWWIGASTAWQADGP
jgi:hypothetical protein